MPSYIYLSTIYLSLKYTDLARVNTLQLRGRVVLKYHSSVRGNTELQDNLPQPGTGTGPAPTDISDCAGQQVQLVSNQYGWILCSVVVTICVSFFRS